MKKTFLLVAAFSVMALQHSCRTKMHRSTEAISPNFSVIQAYDGFSSENLDSTMAGNPPIVYVNGKDTIIYRHEQITLDGSPYYLVEGDILMTPREYNRYRNKTPLFKRWPFKRKLKKLWGMQDENGHLLHWPKDSTLTFAINAKSFATPAQYELVRKNLIQAVSDWQGICDVRFSYISSMDNLKIRRPTNGLVFLVIGVESYRLFYASAFPPTAAADDRVLRIDSTYFTTNEYDRVGMLRHEIGHVLGFLHEQNREGAPAACKREVVKGNFKEVTKYDSVSVMHYFCDGIGNRKLEFSAPDIAGAAEVFGKPR